MDSDETTVIKVNNEKKEKGEIPCPGEDDTATKRVPLKPDDDSGCTIEGKQEPPPIEFIKTESTEPEDDNWDGNEEEGHQRPEEIIFEDYRYPSQDDEENEVEEEGKGEDNQDDGMEEDEEGDNDVDDDEEEDREEQTEEAVGGVGSNIVTIVMGLECDLCSKPFEDEDQLRVHKAECDNVSPGEHQCEICGEQFKLREPLRRHRLYKHAVKFKCDVCGKGFSCRSELDRHSESHSRTGPRSYECGTCHEKFDIRKNLREHLKNEHKFMCDECNKKFDSESRLRWHMKTHSSDPLYKCNICDRTFNVKNTYQFHMNVHANKFVCPECGHSFGDNSFLLDHLQSHNTSRTYKCSYCPNLFKTQRTLRLHMIKHSDKYKCHVCQKKFDRNVYLKNHLRRHLL